MFCLPRGKIGLSKVVHGIKKVQLSCGKAENSEIPHEISQNFPKYF